MKLSSLYFKVLSVKFLETDVSAFLSLKMVLILANSPYTDEMPHYAEFHQGLHCLPKYEFTSIQNEKGKVEIHSLVSYKLNTLFILKTECSLLCVTCTDSKHRVCHLSAGNFTG